MPSPGATTRRYGGNTPCVQVGVGPETLILDAGTGIRELGRWMVSHPGPQQASLFLTHYHWDHIQGFPFFSPAYDPDFRIHVLGPTQETGTAETLVRGQMRPGYFPVPPEALSARIEYGDLAGGAMDKEGTRIRTMRMRHASFTVAYRVDHLENTLVFIPDNELVGGHYPVDSRWRERLVNFISGADLLVHDAMYTDQEYPDREGWGHSTFSQAVALAREAAVKRLHFFHHSPERTDDELDGIVDSFRNRLDSEGEGLDVDAAREGREFDFSRSSYGFPRQQGPEVTAG